MTQAPAETLSGRLMAGLERPWEEPVAAWRERNPGGRVVGCFPVYSPIELIHAAGAMPVGLFGGGTQIELAAADSRFVSFVCSIAKSTLELALQGKLSGFDALFFHSICDVARNLSSVVQRSVSTLRVEYIHLPQNPSSPSALGYYVAELKRVTRTLEELTGRRVTAAKLARSVAAYDGLRGAIQALHALRAKNPDRISTTDLYVLGRVATWMPVETATELLRKALEDALERPVTRKDRIRVVVEGAFCEQPPLDFLRAVEEAGCHVVADDFHKGWRWFSGPVAGGRDPWTALARAYLDRSVHSSVRHDWRTSREEALAESVAGSRADAVIFCIAKFCEPALFDYVLFKRELDRRRIPHLLIEFEEKMWTFDRTRDEVETFVESILFR